MKFLISSGGTIVPLDEVRRIQNMSSGRFGSKLARAALEKNHEVDFLYAHNSETPLTSKVDFTNNSLASILKTVMAMNDFSASPLRENYVYLEYKTFYEYQKHLETLVKGGKPKVVVLAAAVSDYGPPDHCFMPPKGKISSDKEELVIHLKKLPKIIEQVKKWNSEVFLVGFKLVVNASIKEMENAAKKQIKCAGTDLVVVNDLSSIKLGNHELFLYTKNGLQKVITGGNAAYKLIEEIEKMTI